jgi:hypothetical protein
VRLKMVNVSFSLSREIITGRMMPSKSAVAIKPEQDAYAV